MSISTKKHTPKVSINPVTESTNKLDDETPSLSNEDAERSTAEYNLSTDTHHRAMAYVFGLLSHQESANFEHQVGECNMSSEIYDRAQKIKHLLYCWGEVAPPPKLTERTLERVKQSLR
jgi:hypothetical protein